MRTYPYRITEHGAAGGTYLILVRNVGEIFCHEKLSNKYN
jgi:hypothetical protein